MMKPNNKRFNMTYSNREAPVLVPIEYQLMKEMGCDRSELHKTAIKELWNRRQKSMLTLVWGDEYGSLIRQNYFSSKADAGWTIQEVEDENWWPHCRTHWGNVCRQTQEEEMRSAMSFYEQTLQQVVDATGDGKSYRDDPQPLTARLKAGEVYAVRWDRKSVV